MESAALSAGVSEQNVLSPTNSIISIYDLLKKSNTLFTDIFSEDVYNHFGKTKNRSTKLGSTTKFALDMSKKQTDSEGKTLSKEQVEYFMDSKVVDNKKKNSYPRKVKS